ncbi:MAG: signal peptidase II [Defluviitaleaceae bacterium]|nr:signal peptidase II [Defluviitaleaceae bacterium]
MKIFKIINPILLTFLFVALDQWSKHFAVTNLMGHANVVVIPNILSLTFHRNWGAAFGIFPGGRWFFLGFAVVVLVVIGFYYVKLPNGRIYNLVRFFLILIAAGGIGNSIDRLLHGYVVDFLRFDFINFPIFNIADIYVVSGTILLGILMIFFIKEEQEEK